MWKISFKSGVDQENAADEHDNRMAVYISTNERQVEFEQRRLESRDHLQDNEQQYNPQADSQHDTHLADILLLVRSDPLCLDRDVQQVVKTQKPFQAQSSTISVNRFSQREQFKHVLVSGTRCS